MIVRPLHCDDRKNPPWRYVKLMLGSREPIELPFTYNSSVHNDLLDLLTSNSFADARDPISSK